MSKILYITDLHLKGISPRRRIDNYCDAIKAKIVESLELAKKHKVKLIICGGDVFDGELVSNRLSDWVIDIVDEYSIPMYITPGNHDQENSNWALSGATSLAHMFRRSKLIKELGEYEDNNVYIKGQEYYVGIEEDLNKEFPQHNKADKYTIYVPHAMIVDKKVPFMSNIYYGDIKTNYDAVLVSHNHTFFGMPESNGSKIIAPGSIARCKADECDMGRIPSVAIIDTSKQNIKIVALKSAKPVEEIFDLEKLAIEKETKKKLQLFTEGLKNTKVQTMNAIDAVLAVCKASNTPDAIVDNLKKRISLNEKPT